MPNNELAEFDAVSTAKSDRVVTTAIGRNWIRDEGEGDRSRMEKNSKRIEGSSRSERILSEEDDVVERAGESGEEGEGGEAEECGDGRCGIPSSQEDHVEGGRDEQKQLAGEEEGKSRAD
jgi:hypothetical protein